MQDEHPQHFASYWPSVSDIFITLFVVAIVMVGSVSYVLMPKGKASTDRPILVAVGLDMKHIRNPVNLMRRAIAKEELRPSQTPAEVIGGLDQTANDVVSVLKELEKANRQLHEENARLKDQVKTLVEESKDPKSLIESLQLKLASALQELNDKPPIIRIDEATREYRFGSGSAVMQPAFKENLNQREFKRLAEEIIKRNSQGAHRVDTLEVVGHTDGEALHRRGNLDYKLPAYLSGIDQHIEELQPGSNNDLGLLRALSLRSAWGDFVRGHPQHEVLEAVSVRCYSAGQTIPEGKNYKVPDSYRLREETLRRIEVRLTKLGTD